MPIRSLISGVVLVVLAGVCFAWQDPTSRPKPITMAERLKRMAAMRTNQPSAKVHAILVGDTEDAKLGDGVVVDLKRVGDLLTKDMAQNYFPDMLNPDTSSMLGRTDCER